MENEEEEKKEGRLHVSARDERDVKPCDNKPMHPFFCDCQLSSSLFSFYFSPFLFSILANAVASCKIRRRDREKGKNVQRRKTLSPALRLRGYRAPFTIPDPIKADYNTCCKSQVSILFPHSVSKLRSAGLLCLLRPLRIWPPSGISYPMVFCETAPPHSSRGFDWEGE